MYLGHGDVVEMTDFPGHWTTIEGSAACETHPDDDHESYLVHDPMGDETWACQTDLQFIA